MKKRLLCLLLSVVLLSSCTQEDKNPNTDPVLEITVEIAEVISAPKINHNYIYRLVSDSVYVGATVQVMCSCEWCGNSVVDNKVVKIVDSTHRHATCVSFETSRYTVLLSNGKTTEFTITIEGVYGDHQLNGGSVTAGTIHPYPTEGVKFLVNSMPTCNQEDTAYFFCEACDNVVVTESYGPHDPGYDGKCEHCGELVE